MKNNDAYIFDSILPSLELTTSTDGYGNLFVWASLPSAEMLLEAAKGLAKAGARLCAITAFNTEKFAKESDMELVYNFDLDGKVLTLSIRLTPERRVIPSLIDHFSNADWHEREFAELFDIELSGREKPKRLFLDPSIDTGIFNRLIPLSSMMNGSSTKQLWETIFAETSMPDWAKETK
ncbi:NADH-quinone oxidoreductase subunit C [Desulfobaculum bizertense]|uniref:Respiratory-chain NADH dehydrogenase, subunit n=1 Tax=Desulfobaculum bizertense DSM 18034 TaxID=1121442 RepID=A0A1T4VSK1_9BACT|nr:NADH-quinone oxidoreductase subunit C [Desulfobaculum bizertense]SKA67818.1 Respiratory-chain NADH dehydrogenase, subunit [Desulfobaculum bizertense DSM 18034]